ncbi:hypothetical protein B0H10DRAFT_2214596 [Mycena sp. CBHHK59/15]|nr:hypothetical protein B0H10DRAFT_2214596 [Mycena sp. CBHHK59/15]
MPTGRRASDTAPPRRGCRVAMRSALDRLDAVFMPIPSSPPRMRESPHVVKRKYDLILRNADDYIHDLVEGLDRPAEGLARPAESLVHLLSKASIPSPQLTLPDAELTPSPPQLCAFGLGVCRAASSACEGELPASDIHPPTAHRLFVGAICFSVGASTRSRPFETITRLALQCLPVRFATARFVSPHSVVLGRQLSLRWLTGWSLTCWLPTSPLVLLLATASLDIDIRRDTPSESIYATCPPAWQFTEVAAQCRN